MDLNWSFHCIGPSKKQFFNFVWQYYVQHTYTSWKLFDLIKNVHILQPWLALRKELFWFIVNVFWILVMGINKNKIKKTMKLFSVKYGIIFKSYQYNYIGLCNWKCCYSNCPKLSYSSLGSKPYSKSKYKGMFTLGRWA